MGPASPTVLVKNWAPCVPIGAWLDQPLPGLWPRTRQAWDVSASPLAPVSPLTPCTMSSSFVLVVLL